MGRNIEIKARSRDVVALTRAAAKLADGPPALIMQEDTFFCVPRGRLKLREFGDGRGELIQYERQDSSGPKQSTYVRSPAVEPDSLKAGLAAALGVRAVVKKRRTVFLVGQTRVHLDEVEGLGNFMELEVVLRTGQTEAEGAMIAQKIISDLGIEQSDLVTGAYVDLLAGYTPNKRTAGC
ncbi:class IV adenylate cyclase [Thiohalomonas denitrificans]|uniref:class IV adenylate cyclase n=1 Tax=Thiohalomonas denitrificans TaxID=415747 RepID=UPI0026EE2609|nr:class IV adenylate cyclase [Thiohalomonas denitrificans]